MSAILLELHLLVLFLQSVVSGEIVSLACQTGTQIHFECSCCPGEVNTCRFKKRFQGGFISYDGQIIPKFSKFEYDASNTGIVLNDCAIEDEGAYIWMCGRRNLNNQFNLEVYQKPIKSDYTIIFEDETMRLECPLGSKVHFKCPCPVEICSCRFEKGAEVIAQKSGLSAVGIRFTFDGKNTGATLNKCEEKDQGIYEWICDECHVKKNFLLIPIPYGVTANQDQGNSSVTPEPIVNMRFWIPAILATVCIGGIIVFAILICRMHQRY